MTAAKKGKRKPGVVLYRDGTTENFGSSLKRKAWRPSDESVYAALREYYPKIKSLSALPKACFTDMRRALIAAAKVDGIGK